MADEKNGPPKRTKRGNTAPGFGSSQEPLPPIQVSRVDMADDDELAAQSPGAAHGGAHLSMEPAPSAAVEMSPAMMAAIAAASANHAGQKRVATPAVDIDLVYEKRSAPLPDAPWTFLEIWTRNTIYALDARLMCIDVIDQSTKRSLLDHPLRGARLVGGQVREGDAMELSHPFPRPGSEAVFEQTQGRHVRFSQTSSVTRVVMRLRVLTVTPDQLLPTWEEVTGTHNLKK
jgi:hypothetical protein